MLWSSALLLGALLLKADASPVEGKLPHKRNANGPYPLDAVDLLEQDSLSKFAAYLGNHPSDTSCTLENAVVRKEWSDLLVPEREEYIKAVLCLQSKPAQAPKDRFPGALSRYDDFVATHITLAMELHSNPHFLPAHRLFIWKYEQALRDECGYTGYQPYWNWGRYAADPINSPLFNGNSSSMGGNGKPSNYSGVPQFGFQAPYDNIPAAGGGGCVTEGPFKDMVVSLGPVSKIVDNIPNNTQADGLGSNPRCLRRDVNRYASAVTYANYTYALITKTKDIDSFQAVMLGTPSKNDWGVHTGGHYTIGGDPGGDFFSSPGDPVFWFHHGMVDRIWWIWQMQDPENRMTQVVSNSTMPPMRKNVALPRDEDTVNLAWLTPTVAVSDLLTNIGGKSGDFCYIYA